MTKLTNYLATVTDVNSVFSAKGAVIPNSERCVIKDDTGQTVGSVGAVNHWNIDTTANPLVTYTNPRLPRWQDLVPLDCNFTFSSVQLSSPPATLDADTSIHIYFPFGLLYGPTLQSAFNLLQTCLLPYYNNNPTLYSQRVIYTEMGSSTSYPSRPLQWVYQQPTGGATKTVNLVFSPYVGTIATGSSTDYAYRDFDGGTQVETTNVDRYVTPNAFLPTRPRSSVYNTDFSIANGNLSTNLRSVVYRTIGLTTNFPYTTNSNNINQQFWQALYRGQGNYSGANGFSNNLFTKLIDNVNSNGNAQYYANLIIQGMNSVGYTLTC